MLSANLWRFLLVGVFSALCDYGSRAALLWLGVGFAPSRAGSFIVGSTVAYLLNSMVTFSGKRNPAEVLRAGVAYGASFGTAVAVDALCRAFLYSGSWAITAAWVTSQACATTLNYLLQSRWVFRG
ncbi:MULTISPECIES: GtrA family protein [unclassified Corynebacterium]|uniref:GtrA family protein n=1 Tax=unclassified Corynebacterium TaxID=2624378 RepID=UPI0029C9B94F|nr:MULTISPECIES: GtrA family protein [unclassified Corynebacterium]WPF66052.1 GtrA family protein [Corynebacterium sp. 22KM0430]WPF68545.1 GtrA family protein [Corynebacterium sp. 21KM1197]